MENMCIALPSNKEKYRIWWFDNASMVKDILLARNGKMCRQLFEKHLDRDAITLTSISKDSKID